MKTRKEVAILVNWEIEDIISTSENSIIVNKEISMKEILIRISPFFQADSYFVSDIGKHFIGRWL